MGRRSVDEVGRGGHETGAGENHLTKGDQPSSVEANRQVANERIQLKKWSKLYLKVLWKKDVTAEGRPTAYRNLRKVVHDHN